ncbi:12460_t:CDS:2 [Entrophospora sp. SA101]|nr:12460_t:CDS:2 [Entrophospora sp. SA101]
MKEFGVKTDKWIDKVENADSIFIGAYSPGSCDDYTSGTNHTLPTYEYAKMYSGLTKEGLDRLCDTVMRLAEVEGLKAHRKAVHVRIKDITLKEGASTTVLGVLFCQGVGGVGGNARIATKSEK